MIPLKDYNPTTRRPVVTVTLIALCVVTFLWQIGQGARGFERTVYGLGMIPAVLTGRAELVPELVMVAPWMTLFTSMFLHGGWMHLIGNMLYLWIFGNNVEDRLGHGGFLAFYLASGLAAAALQILPDPAAETPMVGASGAISGVLGAYLVFFPRARVLVLIPVGFLFVYTLPAGWLLGFWFLFQILSALGTPASAGGVAWWAHIGGFAFGALVAFFLKRSPRRPRVSHRRGPWG